MSIEHSSDAHPKMPRWAKIAGLLFLAVLAFVVVPEMLFAGFYFLQDGRWVSVSDRLKGTQNIYVGDFNTGGGSCRYIDMLYPHPYLAFVFHNNSPCRQAKVDVVKGLKPANTEGFLEDRDFPLERSQESYDILLLGGSVAQQLGQYAEGGPNFLESVLNRCFTPPHGTRFQVFNGASGAWKQPQQAITFLLYGRGFSGVVSVEGFNEISSLFLNPSERIELPASTFVAVNPFAAQTYRSVALAFLTNQMLAWEQSTWVGSHSYMAYFVVDRLRMIFANMARAHDQRTSVDTLFSLPETWSINDRIAFNTQQYYWYINAINEVARRNGIDFAVFMQPVPAIDRPLTTTEKAVVGNLSYGERYFQLTRDLMEMAKEGQAHLYSLLSIFKDVHDPIYADWIHPDNHGGEVPAYRLMAWHIAHQLASAWSFEQSGRCKNDVASAGLPGTYEKALLSMDLSGSDVTINVDQHRH